MIGKDYLLQSLDDLYPFKGQILNDMHSTVLVLFKQVAKVYGLPSLDVTKITKDARVKTELLTQSEYTGWLKSEVESHNIKWSNKWVEFEKELDFCYKYGGSDDEDGIIYNQSKHASGVILYPSKDQYVLPRANGQIPYCGHALEGKGFIKYDCLSVESLDSISHFIPEIEKKTGKSFNWDDTNDPKVWEVFKRGDTDLVFQFSSDGMKRILKAKKPDTIEKLAELNALYRPAAISSGILERYLNNDYTDEEKVIGKFLKKEFGEDHAISMIYQEDIIRIVQGMTKFSATEADNIRRCVTKKKFKELEGYKDQFIRDFRRDEFGDIAEYVWNAIEEFCSYTFNKSHAVSYSMTAYWQAYIYTYWPNEYMSFFLNTGKNSAQALTCLIEHGLKVKYPNWEHTGTEFYVEDNTIYLPLKSKPDENIKDEQPSLFFAPTPVDGNFASQIMFRASTANNNNIMKCGILDTFCKDRKALRDLSKELSKKSVAKNVGQSVLNSIQTNDFEEFLEQLQSACLIKDVETEQYTDGKVYKFKLIGAKTCKDFTVNDTLIYNQMTNATEDIRAFGLVRPAYVSECPCGNENVVSACNEDMFARLQTIADNITNAAEIDNPDLYLQNEQKKVLTNLVSKYYSVVKSGYGLRVWGQCQDQVKACVKEVSIASDRTPKATLVFSNREVEVTLNKYLKDDFKKMDKYTIITCELDHIYTLDMPSQSANVSFRVSRLSKQTSSKIDIEKIKKTPAVNMINEKVAQMETLEQKQAETSTMETLRELFQENKAAEVVPTQAQQVTPSAQMAQEIPVTPVQPQVAQTQSTPPQIPVQELSIEEQYMMAEICEAQSVVGTPAQPQHVVANQQPVTQQVAQVTQPQEQEATAQPQDITQRFNGCVMIDYDEYSKTCSIAEAKYLARLLGKY